ncbi:hypothetical protein RvY_15563 [Ramazzottius varieornatus]|uniref:TATA element modulatory factor 1 TATA binding domain-containing protein n=1 Tax=Ramazzottius varieornatus TaxID=947166 RepID=A0A1D1VWW9_RAMVA|nr:hypothetical protein RvY_15563 [Ramazzottius varieornatus]
MSWFDSSNWANIAKNATETAKIALKQAQKNIDKVLEIQEISRQEGDPASGHETLSENGSASGIQSRSLSPLPKLIKDETDGFFDAFGVNDSKPSSKRGSSSRSSLLESSSEPTSKLKSPQFSPSISRVASSSSLSRLNGANGWKSSELQAVVTDSRHSPLTTTSPTPSHSFVETVDLQPEPSASSVSLLPDEPTVPSDKYNEEKASAKTSFSTNKTDYTSEDFTDDGPQPLPSQISQGRLEILFQDEDDKNFVDIPLDTEHSLGETIMEVKEFSQGRSLTAVFDEDSEPDLRNTLARESLPVQAALEDVPLSLEEYIGNAADDSLQSAYKHVTVEEKPTEDEIMDIKIRVEDVDIEGSSQPYQNIDISKPGPKEPIDRRATTPEEEVEIREAVALDQEETHEEAAHLTHVHEETGEVPVALVLGLEETERLSDQSSAAAIEETSAKTHHVPTVVVSVPEELKKELQHLREVLAARERKLVDICSENAQLKEEKDNLSSQVADLTAAHSQLETFANDRGDEITMLEGKLHIASEEKESLMEQLQLTKIELANANASRMKSDSSASLSKDLQRQLQEKELLVKELMEEGEKLSKQQFQSSSHIKKIKQKQKELEAEVEKLKGELEGKTNEVATLKNTLAFAEDLDQKNTIVIKQLSANVDRLEKDLLASRNLHEEAKAKISSMQAALDNAYKELADLHRQKAAHEGHVHETLLTTELAAKEELRLALEQQKQQLVQDQAELMERLEILQANLNRAECTLKRKEDSFRDELADYQQRVNEANKRNEELSQSLSQSTRPLLRQNEALQRQLAEQSSTFEQLELSLTKRHQEAVTQLTLAQEKERAATEKLLVITGKMSALEGRISALREERSSLSSEVDAERHKVRDLSDKLSSQQRELDKVRQLSVAEVSDLRREKQLLEHQLNLEKEKAGMEARKVATLAEQLAELQKQVHASPSSTGQSVNQSPLRRSDSANSTGSTLDGRWSPNSQQGSSLYDVLRNVNMSSLDTVQSSLKQKESEVQYLRQELRQLELSRQRHTDEMLKLTEKTIELDSVKQQLEEMTAAKEDIGRRYNAMLQMYGEKVEEIQELRLDFEDMKALYKSQIVVLTQKQ